MAKTTAKTASKRAAKAGSKTVGNVASKTTAKAGSKTAAGERAAKAASKTAPKAGSKTVGKTVAKTAGKTTAKTAANAGSKRVGKAASKTVAKTAGKTTAKTTAKRAGKAAAKAASKTTAKAGSKTTAKTAAKTRAAAAGGLLARLELALKRRYPRVAASLAKGATPAAIARLRKLAGDGLPESFYNYLQWHDGANDTSWIDGLVAQRTDRIVATKKMMDDILDEGHYAAFADDEWWSKGWFTFADDQSGYSSLVIDTHGSFGGRPGQVMSAAAKDSSRQILAPSFDGWLEIFVEAVEKGYLEAEDDGLRLDHRGRKLFARNPGYPRSCEPQTASVASEPTGEGLTLATRGAWPKAVPDGARWLVAANGEKLAHWFIDHVGPTLTTSSGSDPAALKQVTKKWKNADAAATALDAALRKQLAAGFVFGVPAAVPRGEPLCALHVGDGSNAEFIDLSPDGRTLAVGTTLAEARAARLHLINIETGRRTVLREERPAHGQAFIHRVAFGPGGADLYYQLNAQLYVIPVAGGEPRLLADMAEPPLNPFVTRFGFDRSRERLLYFEKSTVRVRTTAGKDIFKMAFKQGTSEYREAAISPSGKLIALVYVSRGVLYSHEDAQKDKTSEIQIWSVDEAKQLYTLPFKSEMIRRITFSPDDQQVIVGNYSEVLARDVRTGAEVWRREAREWAHSPDGSQLAVVRRGVAVSVLGATTQREAFSVHDSRPWATPYAEIHDPQSLGFSDDGARMYMGNGGGRVYVWQAK